MVLIESAAHVQGQGFWYVWANADRVTMIVSDFLGNAGFVGVCPLDSGESEGPIDPDEVLLESDVVRESRYWEAKVGHQRGTSM
jgi:hypothetical protein